MSGEAINLRLSGPVLSMLLLESSRNHGNAQGLLFGKVNMQTENQVTDHTHIETLSQNIDANDYSVTKLRNICTNNHISNNIDIERCVGLFSCRKFTSKLSVVEEAAHRKVLEQTIGKSGHGVVTILITCDVLPHDHRYRWNFTAYSQTDNGFVPVKMNIHNLGECKHGSYKTSTSSHHSSLVHKIVRNLSTSLANQNSNKFSFVEETKKATDELAHELDMSLSQLQSTQYAVNMARIEHEQLKSKLKSCKAKLLINENRGTKIAVENIENNVDCNMRDVDAQSSIFIPNIMDQQITPCNSNTHILPDFVKPSAPSENDDILMSVDEEILQEVKSEPDDFALLVRQAKQDIKLGNPTS